MAKQRNMKQRRDGKRMSNKGKPNFGKGYSKREEEFSENSSGRGGSAMAKEVVHKYNDVSWYAKNQQMLTDAASFSYNSPLGNPIPFPDLLSEVPNTIVGSSAIPGVMGISFVPTIGISTNSISPANIAANNIYSYVRYMNSGAKNYDQADLMLYMLSMDNIYMFINWMKRMYGYVSTYSQYNKYIPAAFASVDRVDINNLRANLADFRLFINNCCARASAFCVPAVMPLFVRHSWMCSNIYKDSDSMKSQIYMYKPQWFYAYDETGSKYGGRLIRVTTPSSMTLAQMQETFEKLFAPLAYSEDIGVMSGDILKAYGQDRLFKLSSVEPDYTVFPVYNEEVLSQIHNMTIVQPNLSSTTTASWNITQDPNTGYLIFNPTVIPWAYPPKKVMINMPWDNVTPANTMVATRLTSAHNKDKVVACGSELVVGLAIWRYDTNGKLQTPVITSSPIINIKATSLGTPADDIENIICLSQFDWHPLMHVVVNPGDTPTTAIYCGMVGDINNYTIMDIEDLKNLHSTAILSEFNVPQIGSF